MTAVVAVLNKTGMALAADSAVTVSNSVSSQSKVFNEGVQKTVSR